MLHINNESKSQGVRLPQSRLAQTIAIRIVEAPGIYQAQGDPQITYFSSMSTLGRFQEQTMLVAPRPTQHAWSPSPGTLAVNAALPNYMLAADTVQIKPVACLQKWTGSLVCPIPEHLRKPHVRHSLKLWDLPPSRRQLWVYIDPTKVPKERTDQAKIKQDSWILPLLSLRPGFGG